MSAANPLRAVRIACEFSELGRFVVFRLEASEAGRREVLEPIRVDRDLWPALRQRLEAGGIPVERAVEEDV